MRSLRLLGADYQHLDFVDATFRKSKIYPFLSKTTKLAQHAPTLTHIYPSAKKQFSGKVSFQDQDIAKALTQQLKLLTRKKSKLLFLTPLGVGGHVDHILIQRIAKKLAVPTVYWEDFPYNVNPHAVKKFFSQNKDFKFFFKILPTDNRSKKYRAIQTYTSQIKVLFSREKIPQLPERYYTSRDLSSRVNFPAEAKGV